jgi:hypothetical protein
MAEIVLSCMSSRGREMCPRRGRVSILSFLLLILATSALAQPADLGIDPKNIASFKYGDNVQEIWAALANGARPSNQWQFRYEPLFVPEVNNDGTIIYSTFTQSNGHILLQVPIVLDNDKARSLAF